VTLAGALVLIVAALFFFKSSSMDNPERLNEEASFVNVIETTLDSKDDETNRDLPAWALDEMSHGDDDS
tara:strand:- start:538 stop:744 length:207 start_codon:yes stop_codon:yes gene_type:complete